MGWKRLSFTPDQMTSGALSRLGETFNARYLQRGRPKGAVVLDNSDPVNIMNIPDTYYYYLSPEAAEFLPEIVKVYKAESCEEPPVYESSYVWGDERFFHDERVRNMSKTP
jgi:hypothetical protein